MKVNDPNVTGSNTGQVNGAGLERPLQMDRGRRDGTTPEAPLSDSPDQVALSEMSARLRSLNVDSPERIARLDTLSADVASGRYQPDARAISRSLIDEALRHE